MWIQTLRCIAEAETVHNVPPGAVAMMLVQLTDASPVSCYLRVVEHFPDGAPTAPRGTYGAQGQIWYKGEIIPLWNRASGDEIFSARVKRIGLHHKGGAYLGETPVCVCWLERTDLLDAFRYTPAAAQQVWQLPEMELPANVLSGAGDDWTVKNWARVPCRGMRSGALMMRPNVGVPFCLSVAHRYDHDHLAEHRRYRAPVVPLCIVPSPTPVDDDEGVWDHCITFATDPNAVELVVRVWEYVSTSGNAPAGRLTLSQRPLEQTPTSETGSAHLVSAVGTDYAYNSVASCINVQHGGQAITAGATVRNHHGANAVTYNLIYGLNLGLDIGRDQATILIGANGACAAGATVSAIGSNTPWHAAAIALYQAGPVAINAAAQVKVHQS